MFHFPQLIVLIVSAAMTVAYFVMMSDRARMRLLVFFLVSVGFTAAQIVAAVLIPSIWAVYGVGQCLLYTVGSLVHLLTGKRTVRDVTKKH